MGVSESHSSCRNVYKSEVTDTCRSEQRVRHANTSATGRKGGQQNRKGEEMRKSEEARRSDTRGPMISDKADSSHAINAHTRGIWRSPKSPKLYHMNRIPGQPCRALGSAGANDLGGKRTSAGLCAPAYSHINREVERKGQKRLICDMLLRRP